MENNNEEKLIEEFVKKIKPKNNWDPIKKAIDKDGNRIVVIGINAHCREVVYQCELENKENWEILEKDMDTYQHLYAGKD